MINNNMSCSIPGLEEKNTGYTMAEAIEEAKRCLNCKKPSCVPGCPIEHSIPDWIAQLAKGNIGSAMSIISEKSNLASICARVCPHENQCEGHCILNKKGKPIHIGKLERFISDFSNEMELVKERRKPKTRGKIAIVGAGPAGLAAADDLSRAGFEVVVFDKHAAAGGVLEYGIPEYRLPDYIVQREVAKIENTGVVFKGNTIVGVDITVDQIFNDGFDALFIGTGTSIPQSLGIEGEDMKGVIQSPDFLEQVSLYVNQTLDRSEVCVKEGDTVAVIGGGNVAMDTARTALRMGAKSVTVIYRKLRENMPALNFEYEEAVEDGVLFMWQSVTEELIGEEVDGVLTLKKLRLSTPEGEKIIPMDVLIQAIGSKPANKIVSTTEGIDVDAKGYVKTLEDPYGMTTRKGVFAAGDVVHTPKTVVMAMREGKKAAAGIMKYVDELKGVTVEA